MTNEDDRVSGLLTEMNQQAPPTGTSGTVPDATERVSGLFQEMAQQGGPYSGPVSDHFFTDTPAGRILDAFGQDAKAGFGDRPVGVSPELKTAFVKAGTWTDKDYMSSVSNLVRGVNEAWMRPAAGAADLIYRSGVAGLGSAQGGFDQLFKETQDWAQGKLDEPLTFHNSADKLVAKLVGGVSEIGRAVASGEYLPMEGVPHGNLKGVVGESAKLEAARTVKKAIQARASGEDLLYRARAAGIIGEGEAGYAGTVEPSPEDIQARREAATKAGMPELPPIAPPVTDVYKVARTLAPDFFKVYDGLTDLKENLRRVIDTGNPESPEVINAENLFRETNERQLDLVPEYKRIYEHSSDLLPRVQEIEALGKKEPGELPEPVIPEDVKPGKSIPRSTGEIARLEAGKLIAAGVPEDQAHASAAIVQAHYESRASRFQGKLGTPEELYSRDAPNVLRSISGEKPPKGGQTFNQYAGEIEARDTASRGDLDSIQRSQTHPYSSENIPPEDAIVSFGQDSRGSISMLSGKHLIRLFENSDASTFMHETGHQWLEELLQDSRHPVAPEDLLKDVQTVKSWLKIKDDGKVTRGMHEKFARGVERYLMEGKAPSAELASVFTKFKDWLVKIYRKVSALNSPINDDIRRVFDRLLVDDTNRSVKPPAEPVKTVAGLPEEGKSGLEGPGKESTVAQPESTGQPEPEVVNKPDALPLPEEPQKGVSGEGESFLREIPGTGETRTRGLSHSVAVDALEKDISGDLGDLPDYKTLDFAKQAEYAWNYARNHYNEAKSVLRGEEKAPPGLLYTAVFRAVKVIAEKNNDFRTIKELATSQYMPSKLTQAGREIGYLGYQADGLEDSTAIISYLQGARETKLSIKGIDLVSDTEAQQIIAARNKVQALKDIRDAGWTKENGTKYGRALQDLKDLIDRLKPDGRTLTDHIIDVINIPKSALTSILHFSAPFVQGWGMISTGQAWKGFVEMFKYFGSEEAYKDLNGYILGHPDYQFAKDGKLGLTGLSDRLTLREEALQSTLVEKGNKWISDQADKIGFNKLIGLQDINLVRASSRSFTGYLNYVRFSRFSQLLSAARLAGKDVSLGSPVVRDLAKVVNNFTGRGSIGVNEKFINTVPLLNTLFFSPRKIAATIQMFNPYEYIKLSPIARLAAIRQLSGSLMATSAVLGLAAACGAEVDPSPLPSDFGRIQVGEEKLDITGGNAEWISLLGRIAAGREINSRGEVVELSEGYKPVTEGELIWQYFRGKMSPVASFMTDAVLGSDPIGRPFSMTGEMRNKLLPIFFKSVLDFYDQNPEDTAAILPAMAGIFGVGVESPLGPEVRHGVSAWGERIPEWETAKRSDLDRELAKLGMVNRLPLDSIKGVKLTKAQDREYITLSGFMERTLLGNLFRSPSWGNLPDSAKRMYIHHIIQMSRQTAQSGIEMKSLNTGNDIVSKAYDMKQQRGF